MNKHTPQERGAGVHQDVSTVVNFILSAVLSIKYVGFLALAYIIL